MASLFEECQYVFIDRIYTQFMTRTILLISSTYFLGLFNSLLII